MAIFIFILGPLETRVNVDRQSCNMAHLNISGSGTEPSLHKKIREKSPKYGPP